VFFTREVICTSTAPLARSGEGSVLVDGLERSELVLYSTEPVTGVLLTQDIVKDEDEMSET
jgi:hypothetical protein